MTTTLSASLAALLLLAGSPAFASSEAPVVGSATVLASPAYTTAGTEGAPMFSAGQAKQPVTGGTASLSLNSEAFIAPKV